MHRDVIEGYNKKVRLNDENFCNNLYELGKSEQFGEFGSEVVNDMYDLIKMKDNKRIIDYQNFLLYFCNNVGKVEGYTRFHRMIYLTKKELEKLGFSLEYDFSDTLFGGPYDNNLQDDLDSMGLSELINNTDIPSIKGEKTDTHDVSPKNLTKLRSKNISPMLKQELGRENFDKISKLIKELNNYNLKALDNKIRAIEKDKISDNYIKLNNLPEDIRDVFLSALQGD